MILFFFPSLQRNRMSKQRVMPFFPLAGRSSELRSLPNCQPTYGTCPMTQELKFRMATNCSDGFTGNDFFRRKILLGEEGRAVAWHFQWSCDSKTSLALEGALQRTLLLENSNWQTGQVVSFSTVPQQISSQLWFVSSLLQTQIPLLLQICVDQRAQICSGDKCLYAIWLICGLAISIKIGSKSLETFIAVQQGSLPRSRWLFTCLPMQETKEMQVRPLGWDDPLEKEMATHTSILAWKIPWTEEAGGLQTMELCLTKSQTQLKLLI